MQHFWKTIRRSLPVILVLCSTMLRAQTVLNSAGATNCVIPANGVYTLTLVGSDGGDCHVLNTAGPGGSGATMTASFNLTAGDVLRVVVGAAGGDGTVDSRSAGGGGGGTAVILNGNTVLIVAGGGGGGSRGLLGGGGRANTNPTPVGGLAPYAAGGGGFGFAGANATAGSCLGIGGGAATLNTISTGGNGFNQGCTSGGRGGNGFGGGGGQNPQGGGGGGGYAGGAGSSSGINPPGSVGGDSYIHSSGFSISATAGTDGGSGLDNTSGSVTISPAVTVCTSATTPTITASSNPVCNGSSTTLSISTGSLNANANWQWYTGGCGTTAVGSGTSITVSPSASTLYYVRGEGGCAANGNCAVFSVSVASNPTTPVISAGGPTTFCSGGSVVLTSTTAAAYRWFKDGILINGQTANTYTATTSGNYSVSVSNISGCSTSSSAVTVTVNVPPSTPVINGGAPVNICSGNTALLTSSALTGNQWLLNGAAISGQTAQTYATTSAGNYSVRVTNGFGCSSTSAVTSVTVNPLPATPTVNAGTSTTFCSGGSVVLSSSSAMANQWTLNGGSISNETSQTYTATASGVYAVTVSNEFGCTAVSSPTTVTVNPLAADPQVSSTQPTCAVATGSLQVTAPLGAGYTYSVGAGYQSSNSFSNLSPGVYAVLAKNEFGCASANPASITINPQPLIPAAPALSGNTNVCSFIGTGTQITYTASAAGASSYNWTIPPTNVTLVSGQGTPTLTVTFNTGFESQANKQIRATASSVCGTGPLSIIQALVQTPSAPSPITGSSNVCALVGTSSTATYSIAPVNGAAQYTWTAPAGTVLTHPNGIGVNDTLVELQFLPSFSGGTITVRAQNNCGTGAARSFTIGFAAASTPGLISGPTNACQYTLPGGGSASYSVAMVPGASSYTWTAPAGAVVTHPNGTGAADNNILVQYPAGFTAGSISVSATNGCGTSGVRTLAISKLNPATPGVPDIIQISDCADPGGRVYTYTLAAMPSNTSNVNWTVPESEGAVLMSGQGSTSITVSYPATAVSGNVTLQSVGNCASSSIRTLAIKLPACPPPAFGKFPSTLPAAMQRATSRLQAKVFPNPFHQVVSLQVAGSENSPVLVRVMDLSGRVLEEFKTYAGSMHSFGTALQKGVYLVELIQNQDRQTLKMVKE